jgi:dethiobiotin synthetase
MRGVFVTGTGTGVGKTFVGAALAALLKERGLDVGVMKPAETGVTDPEAPRYSDDADRLVEAAGVDDTPDLVVPYRLREPLAPAIAAELEGRKISSEVVLSAYVELRRRHEFLIVEGAGGIAVPFNDELDMADLAHTLDLPILVVSPTGLGAINGSVLTVEYARARDLKILGILLNLRQRVPDVAGRTNPRVIARLTGLPIYGPLDLLASARDSETPNNRTVVKVVGRVCSDLIDVIVAGMPPEEAANKDSLSNPGPLDTFGSSPRGYDIRRSRPAPEGDPV